MSRKRNQRRKQRRSGDGGGRSSGGAMSALRGGFKSFTGTGKKSKPKTRAGKVLDALFWIALVVAGFVVYYAKRG